MTDPIPRYVGQALDVIRDLSRHELHHRFIPERFTLDLHTLSTDPEVPYRTRTLIEQVLSDPGGQIVDPARYRLLCGVLQAILQTGNLDSARRRAVSISPVSNACWWQGLVDHIRDAMSNPAKGGYTGIQQAVDAQPIGEGTLEVFDRVTAILDSFIPDAGAPASMYAIVKPEWLIDLLMCHELEDEGEYHTEAQREEFVRVYERLSSSDLLERVKQHGLLEECLVRGVFRKA